eukprot:6482419-Amphidinium_carterae.1
MPKTAPGSRANRTELPPQLFPCGCPYPSAFSAGEIPTSPRRRGRWTQTRQKRVWVNQAVLYLTWLSLGQPSGGPAVLAACAALHPVQLAMVRDLESQVANWSRPGEPGGGLKEVIQQLHTLRDLDAYARCPKEEGLDVRTVTLEPGKMSLPKKAAVIPMEVPHVPQIVEDVLKVPLIFDLPVCDRPTGHVNMYMQVSSWTGVANALAESGLMQLIPEQRC